MSIIYMLATKQGCKGPVFEQCVKTAQWLLNRGFSVVCEHNTDGSFTINYGDERSVYKPLRVASTEGNTSPSVIWPAGSPEDLLFEFMLGRTS